MILYPKWTQHYHLQNSFSELRSSLYKFLIYYSIIALISHTSKVMLKILQPRLQQYMNHELPDVQAGFRKGRGTIGHIDSIEIDGETAETVSDFIILGSKIIAGSDCSHVIKRRYSLEGKL